jgi:hypothetical protein
MAQLRFGSWERTPLGAAIEAVDNGGELPPPSFKPSVQVTGPSPFRANAPDLLLLGPGGVAGIDPAVVVRTEPPAGTGDAQDNYLACIELSSTELPWLLTPARENEQHRLRPWIVLVVVDAAATPLARGTPLPSIQVSPNDLPDLRDSWAWAHVQYPGDDADLPPGVILSVGQAVSRLLCPRKLEPNTRYRACLVPAFEGGRRAGLGETGDATKSTERAWEVGQAGAVTLPVYYQWEFATGVEGDFEHLVRRLRPPRPEELEKVGGLITDLSVPWPGQKPLTPDAAAQTVILRGALLTPSAAESQVVSATEEALEAFVARLISELNAPADRIEGKHDPDDVTGAVAAPLYGARHVDRERLFEDDAPPWLTSLNLDPNSRVAAGVGAEYVRRNQEELMARAWEQVGAIREANRQRAMAELAKELSDSVHARHVANLTAGELTAVASPAAQRIRTDQDGTLTLSMELTVSPLPTAAASTAFARMLRPQGPLARRTTARVETVVKRGLKGEVNVSDAEPMLARLELSALPAATDTPMAEAATSALVAEDAGALARQVVLMDAVAKVASVNGLEQSAIAIRGSLDGIPDLDAQAVLTFDVRTLRESFMPHLAEVAQATAVMETVAVEHGRTVDEFGVQIEADDLKGRLIDNLAPGDRIARRLSSRVQVPGDDGSSLGPVMRYPSFPVPTSLALLATDREWFLPGIGAFPGNRTALLAVNAPFVAAYLAGINHEFMRELLWREYPTDRRGSPFLRFWPRADGGDDVAPLDAWTGDLEDQLTLENVGVLLVRGDVVRRFPDMVVAAAPAASPQQPNPDQSTWQPPLFVLPIDASTAAYAFDVGPDALLDESAGFFFVFQEHSHRLRFGFDLKSEDFKSWNQLDWARVPMDRSFAFAGRAIDPGPQDPDDRSWNTDAADIARITLQQPFRLAIHATQLVGSLA